VFADVTALFGPVVRRRVDDAQVGGRGVIEDLRRLLVRERIAVRGAVRLQRGDLDVETGEASVAWSANGLRSCTSNTRPPSKRTRPSTACASMA
jgi:hypothetical protein